ncbi:MAG TPA: hypothetical protein VIH61_06920 [Waddliaceae bacterium]
MKKNFFGLLAAFLMVTNFISSAPPKGCRCTNCSCTKEKHCGCHSPSGCQCSPNNKCGENHHEED